MALTVAGLGVLTADVFFRRLLFPVALLSAVVFRYNLLSLVYLLLVVVSLLLPGPRLKSQKVSFVVFDIVVLVFSGSAAIAQALFQISLATGYTLDECNGIEVVWRQIGLVQFNIPAVHVVRLILPDVVIFLAALITLCVNLWVLKLCKSVGVRGDGDGHGEGVTEIEGGKQTNRSSPDVGESSDTNELGNVLSDLSGPPYPATAQCYYRLPKLISYLLDVGVFGMLMLAGVAVPSLTSFAYYLLFLFLLIIWSVHLELKGLVRVLRVVAMIYATLHLVVLDLYQFQSAQDLVPTQPANTTNSLLARLFGLTPVIHTDCNEPYALALQPTAHYTQFLSPAFVMLLLLLLCADFRLWLYTPSLLWKIYGTYSLPVHDQGVSDRLHCLSKHGPLKKQALWTTYGATENQTMTAQSAQSPATSTPSDPHTIQSHAADTPARSRRSRLKKVTWEYLWNNIVKVAETAWGLVLRISFILAIISMMAWSVLYPSWPSLVLLLWTCIIWLIPKINPRDSLLYTSPLLVLYSLVLLLIQYTYSLNLTSSELPRDLDLGPECSNGTDVQLSCRTWVLLVKTLFTVVFFASFHEFVTVVKERVKQRWGNHTHYSLENDGRGTPDAEDVETAVARAKVYKSAYRLVSTYWILLVLGAFLLVTLAGPPSLLKTVYLIFFFLFMITYQITERFWFYFSFIVWWLLVFYAALDLVLVYTYQFDVVSDAWERLFNSSSLPAQNFTVDELFDTIGLMKFDIGEFHSLAISLIPPAVFIAVLAMQLRYFTPKSPLASRLEEEAGATAVDLTTLFPQFVRSAIKRFQDDDDEGEREVGEGREGERDEGGADIVVISPEETGTLQSSHSVQRQGTITSMSGSTIHHPTRLQSCYKFTVYAIYKTKQIIVDLLNIFWRFLELHMHKVVGLTVFAVSISQISALYWLLLLSLVLVFPIPFFNPLTYPILTIYLGMMSISKMVYQTPLIKEGYLNFTTEREMCNVTNMDTGSGLVFNDTYSPRTSDATWIGFHKATNFANYISLPIVASLFMTLWFAARRYQLRYYRSSGTKVENYERGSLFFKVTRRQADRSIISALKYLINHFFEMYGVEVCWAMLAITVAVRIDVYGVIYGLALGLLLFTPRRILAPVWLVYLLVHGILLLAQYFFLLGAPPGLCFTSNDSEEKVYPWSSIMNVTRPTGLKKWFYLSGDEEQILDKNILYADFLVYLLVCLQIRYFTRNPIHQGTPDQTNGAISNYFKFDYWIDYFKVAVFQYSFWVSLFLMFLTAALRVSLFGLLYLLLGLFFLYRGQDMLRDRQRNRHRSWAALRSVTWIILLIRVGLQLLDCVFLGESTSNNNCVILLLFNAVCNRRDYYGSPVFDCPEGSISVGLWVDALNFIVLTVQIIVFDTQYSELLRMELNQKEQNAAYFRDVFDSKVEQQREVSREKREAELQELRERAAHLTETEHKIDHLLYAGVRVPEDIELRTFQVKRKEASTVSDGTSDYADTVSLSSEDPHIKIPDSASDISEEEKGAFAQAWDLVKRVLIEFVDTFIQWLESRSAVYRDVVTELANESESQASSASPDMESRPFVEPTDSYGSTGQGTKIQTGEQDPEETHTVDVTAEVHSETTGDAVDDDSNQSHTSQEAAEGASPENKEAKTVVFDVRGDTWVDELHIAPSEKEREQIESFEGELEEKVKKYSTRPRRLLLALYYMFLSHSEYIVFFLMILNIVLNGSIISLFYAALIFCWGLLSIPWPTKRFWLVLILYTMLVLVTKYGFQFYDLDALFWSKHFDENSGLYPPRLIGILHRDNFFTNAVWDVLLLIALLLHRGLLRQYGLWRSIKNSSISNVCLLFFRSVKNFFSRLLSPDISQGAKDYYTIMLFFDVLCFLTIVLGVNSFGVGVQSGNVAAVAEYIRTNYIPLPFVIMLLLQFLSMLVDRAIYLRHSVVAKLIFQVILLIGWHVWLFFVLPSDNVNRRPFTENAAAQCIYFFKCCYFIVSSIQIATGYPTRILGYFLTRSYDIISWLGFLVYRLIPLLPELREVMDWVFTDTTLSLTNWFKVQEIYAQLYLIKVQRTRELTFPRDLGEKQSWLTKIVLGVILVAALVLLIWGPLLVISVISTSNQSNPPVEVSIKLTLAGYEPLIKMTAPQQSVSRLNITEYAALKDIFQNSPVFPVFDKEYFIDDFSRVSFPGVSTSLWTISPPSRDLLTQELEIGIANSSRSIPLDFSWSITRKPATGLASETVSGTTSQVLHYSTNNDTIESFLDALNNRNGSVGIANLYPTIIHAPANSASSNFSELSRFIQGNHSSNVSCWTSLDSNHTNQEWWGLSCRHSLPGPEGSSLHMYIYSERIAPPLFSAVASIGILGLYISVVLVIGRFIRSYIADLPTRLYIDEILNPDPLLKLCNDIFLVRESLDFQLEEILVGKLFYIFKSPEKVAKATRGTPKLKVD